MIQPAYTRQNVKQTKEKAEEDLINIFDWFQHKKVTINYEKPNVPFSSYKSNFRTMDMNVGSQSIKIHAKNELKYLGVTINANMQWGIHINEIIKTLRP